MIRRRALVLLASLSIGGCQLLAGPSEPVVGAQLADGSVLVNRGSVDGRLWSVTASRSDGRICMSIEAAGATSGSSCVELAPEQAGGAGTSQGVTSGPEMPTVIDGVTGPAVERIELTTAAGNVEVPVVALTALGASAKAYAVAVPPSVAPEVLVQFDAAGNELERTNFSP